jgi:hypothetical protein
MSKNTTEFLTITTTPSEQDLILAEGADVDKILAGALRAPSQYGEFASHRTNSTRKYQCNASLAYEECIMKLVKKNELEKDGQAIRMIMEAGLKALGFGDIVAEVEALREDA